jgi:ribosomal protein S27E
MLKKIAKTQSGTKKLVTCPWCFGKNQLYKRSANSIYRCETCGNQLSDPFRLSTSKILSTKPIRIICFSLIFSAGFLMPFARNFFADSPSPSALSQSITPELEIVPNQPIIIPETPSLPDRQILIQNNRSLPSSQVIEPFATEGRGSLSVFNGNSSDAYIKLVDTLSNELVASFYVKSNSTFTLEGVPDGSYKVIFASGEDWDSNTQSFTMNKSFTEFETTLNFRTIQYTDEIRYSIHEITLHQVENGNVMTSEVDEQEFSQY